MSCAGIGKTTLANKLCVRWARDGFLAENFDAVVLIPLRSVQQRTLEEVIVEHIGEENYQQVKESAGSRCLIILEGFDELAIDHRQSDLFLLRLIKECTVLEEATILITSRPHACEEIDAGRRVEVVGFGNHEIREFVEKYFVEQVETRGKRLCCVMQQTFVCHGNRTIVVLAKVTVSVKITVLKIHH